MHMRITYNIFSTSKGKRPLPDYFLQLYLIARRLGRLFGRAVFWVVLHTFSAPEKKKIGIGARGASGGGFTDAPTSNTKALKRE